MREVALTRAPPARSSRLRDRVRRALEGAEGRRMIRVHQELALDDPWALLGSPMLEGHQLAAWAAPAESGDDRCLLAIGVSRARHPEGAGRFREAAALWELLDQSLVELPRAAGGEVARGLPVLFAGFAFSATSATRSELWRGWGDSALWVPEILIHRYRGRTRAALAISAGPGAAPEGVCDRIEAAAARLDRLLAEERAPRPAPSVAGKNKMARVGRDAAAWELWRDRVEAARADVREGRLRKVVLARTERFQPISGRAGPGRRFDPLDTALTLRERQTRCTTFCVRLPDGRSFVGATPEELVRLEDRRVQTMALAGTRSRGWDAASDEALAGELLASDKDRREQALVAEDIRAALAPVVRDLHIPRRPSIARFADVQHLKTAISARLEDGVNLFDLVERLHPTPAVGGLPRREALSWLDANEGLDRGWYAGPLGWVAPGGDGVFVVAIRSALLRGSEAAAFAGCGLVERSDARAEWQETIFKLRAISQSLALGEGL